MIEMLLVVAIISLLIAILLPSLKFKVANDTKCAANLKLIYASTVSYSISNVSYLPGSRSWVGNSWRSMDTVRNGTLYSYMGKNEAAYVCPEFVATPRSIWHPNYGGVDYRTVNTIAFTYSLNEYAGNDWAGTFLRTIKRAKKPEALYMYGDENPWVIPGLSTHPINNGAMGIGGYGPAGSIVDCIGSFHKVVNNNYLDGYANVVFFDGHVDLVHVSQSKEVVTPQERKF